MCVQNVCVYVIHYIETSYFINDTLYIETSADLFIVYVIYEIRNIMQMSVCHTLYRDIVRIHNNVPSECMRVYVRLSVCAYTKM